LKLANGADSGGHFSESFCEAFNQTHQETNSHIQNLTFDANRNYFTFSIKKRKAKMACDGTMLVSVAAKNCDKYTRKVLHDWLHR